MPASNKQARAALMAMLGQPMALVDGREGLVRAVAASYDGGRGLRPLFRQAGRRVVGAGAECVPSAAGKLARRLARKMLARRPDVGIFSLSEPSGRGSCPESSECTADATSSLGGRCVEVAPTSVRQRGLQGVQDDTGGYECSGVYLGECCEGYRSACAEVVTQYCEQAQIEGRYHYSQECIDFFEGEAATPLEIVTTNPTTLAEGEVAPTLAEEVDAPTLAEEEERKFQICQANCPDIAVCDCIYYDAPSANYNESTCASSIASACRSGILPSCRETGALTSDDIAYCSLYKCYEKFGELIPQCSCGSTKGLCEYCDANPSAEICIDGLDGQIMNVCENAPVDGTYHYSQTCIDYFNGVITGTTASAATESAQTTDATTATDESTTTTVATEASAVSTTAAESESTTTIATQGGSPATTTTKGAVDELGSADPEEGTPPSSAGKATIGWAAALGALSMGISHRW